MREIERREKISRLRELADSFFGFGHGFRALV